MRIRSLFLFLFIGLWLIPSHDTLEIEMHPLTESEWKRNARNLIKIEATDLEKIRKAQEPPKKIHSLLQQGNFQFELQPGGLSLAVDGVANFADLPLEILPSGWILNSISAGVELSFQKDQAFFLSGVGEQAFFLEAFYPIAEKKNHWMVGIPLSSPTLGRASISVAEVFESVQVMLKTPAPFKEFDIQGKTEFPLSGVTELQIRAQVRVKQGIAPVVKQPPKLQKSRKPLVYVKSQHSFDVRARRALYQLKSKLQISRNPIQELKLNIPSGFELGKIEISGGRRFSFSDDGKLEFPAAVHDQLEISIEGEFPLKEETPRHFLLESAPITFRAVEEERGHLMFFTQEVVRIEETSFKKSEVLNRVDATELPEEMTRSKETPILWAFRYFEPQLDFLLQSISFEPYLMPNLRISSFQSQVHLNDDLSASHTWMFEIKAQEQSSFPLPIPAGYELLSCYLGGREVNAYQDQEGNFSLDIPASKPVYNQRNRRIQFTGTNQALSSLDSIQVKIRMESAAPPEKKRIRLPFHLPADSQRIKVSVLPPGSHNDPRISTNFHSGPDVKQDFWSNLQQIYSHYCLGLPLPWKIQNLLFLAFGFVFVLVIGFRYGWVEQFFLGTGWKTRLKGGLVLSVLIGTAFFSYQFITEPPMIERNIAPAFRSSGHFIPVQTGVSAWSQPQVASSLTFQAPHGSKEGFFVELDYSSNFWPPSPTGSHLLVFLVAIMAAALFRKKMEAGIGLLLVAILCFQVGGHMKLQSMAVSWLPFEFCLILVIFEGLSWKRIWPMISVLLAINLSSNLEAMAVYSLEKGAKKLHFLQRNDYLEWNRTRPKPQAFLSAQKIQSRLFLKEHSLYAEVIWTVPGRKNQPIRLDFPFKSQLLQGIFNAGGEPLDYRVMDGDSSAVYLPADQNGKITGRFLVGSPFPAELSLETKALNIPIQSLQIPEFKGYNVDFQSPVHIRETKDGNLYFLGAGRSVRLFIERRLRKAQPVPAASAVETQILEKESLHVKALHTLYMEENFLSGKVDLLFHGKGKAVKELVLTLPKGLAIKGVQSTKALADWFVDKSGKSLMLEYETPRRGTWEVSLQVELPFKDKQGTLGTLYQENADEWINQIQLSANENLSFEIHPSAEFLTSVSGKIPEPKDSAPTYTQVLKKGVIPKGQNLAIAMIPRQVVHAVSAYIDSLEITTFLQKSGQFHTRYRFQVRNNGQQFLKLRFQDYETIISAKINGSRSSLGKSENLVLVPMKMVFGQNREVEPFLFECTTRGKVPLKDFSIRVPGVNLDIASVEYNLGSLEELETEELNNSSQSVLRLESRRDQLKFLGRKRHATLSSMKEIPIDFPVFLTDSHLRYRGNFLSANQEFKDEQHILRWKSPPSSWSFVGYLAVLILGALVFLYPCRFLGTAPLIVTIAICGVLYYLFAKTLTPYFQVGVLLLFWTIPFLLLSKMLNLRAEIEGRLRK